MVCIEKRPYTLYGRLATLHFRYLTCLLDRGHINSFIMLFFSIHKCQKPSSPLFQKNENSFEVTLLFHYNHN